VDRLVGIGGTVAAQRLLLGGDLIDGAEAHRLGLVHWMAGDDDLETAASVVAARVAGQSAAALREAKRLLAATRRKAAPGAAEVEVAAFEQLIHDEEPRARIRALLARLAMRSGQDPSQLRESPAD
jgi:enoyl-CoA hydratase/carnithine racemase